MLKPGTARTKRGCIVSMDRRQWWRSAVSAGFMHWMRGSNSRRRSEKPVGYHYPNPAGWAAFAQYISDMYFCQPVGAALLGLVMTRVLRPKAPPVMVTNGGGEVGVSRAQWQWWTYRGQ